MLKTKAIKEYYEIFSSSHLSRFNDVIRDTAKSNRCNVVENNNDEKNPC